MAANEGFENSTYLPAGDRSQANCEKSLALGGGLGNCGQRKERWCVSKNELRNVTTGNFEGWDRPVSSCLFSSHFFTCHVRTVYHPGGLVPRCRDALRRRAERVGGRKGLEGNTVTISMIVVSVEKLSTLFASVYIRYGIRCRSWGDGGKIVANTD